MAVKNVGHTEDFRGFENRTGVQGKPFRDIRIVAGRRPIKSIPGKERRVVDKVELHTGVLSLVQDGTKAILIIERNGYAGQDNFGLGESSLSIFGQIYGDRMPERGERLGKRTQHVGQSPRLRKGYALRSGEDNAHE